MRSDEPRDDILQMMVVCHPEGYVDKWASDVSHFVLEKVTYTIERKSEQSQLWEFIIWMLNV